MILKRIFWLALAGIIGWVIWMRLRERQEEFAATTPQFAAPRTFVPPVSPTPPLRQADPDEALPATPEPAVPAAVEPPPPVALATPEAPPASAEPATEILGYCMRCKTKRPIQNVHHETTESGRPAARGTCPVCGAKMFTFLATNDDV
ncbi:MAG TPA: DUF5679 domain-containing protein [Roseiflexaceae bacterium]|nr:DUF5679 domain-containing protein [Roseiflexaceae bacterium]